MDLVNCSLVYRKFFFYLFIGERVRLLFGRFWVEILLGIVDKYCIFMIFYIYSMLDILFFIVKIVLNLKCYNLKGRGSCI